MATLEQLSAQMAQMQQALQQSQTQNQALRTQLDSLQQAQQGTRQAAQQAVQQARDEVRQVQAQAMNLGNLGTAVTELSANQRSFLVRRRAFSTGEPAIGCLCNIYH